MSDVPNKYSRKSVPDYLREVDYESLNGYVPSAFAIEYTNFIKIIGSGLDLNLSPPVHYRMIDGLISKKQMLANLCHRGLGKTTLMTVNLALYLAIFQYIPNFGHLNTMIFVGDTMDNGVKNVRKSIENLYNTSPFLKQYLPVAKFTDIYIEFENIDGKKFGIKLYGAKTGVRGVNIFNKRPELCIFDDLLSSSDASSPTVIESIKETIYKDVLPALHPTRRKIIFNGTPFNKNDPLYEIVESGVWDVNVYPVCEEFPCKREEFRGSWEDRFTFDFVQSQYDIAVNSGQIKAFRQEYMLQIASEDDRMILDDDLRWFNSYELLANKQKYTFVITTDFATSAKAKSDYTVIGVWALDIQGNRFLIDGKIGRQLMNETFNDIFRLVQEYKPFAVGIEIAGQQGAFISMFYEEMNRRNIHFNIASAKGRNQVGIPAQTNKMNRLRLSVPFFKQGKFYLPTDKKNTTLIQELLEELSLVTIDGIKSKHDDVLDMVSQLDQIHLLLPDEYQSKLSSSDNSSDPFFTETLIADGHRNQGYLA